MIREVENLLGRRIDAEEWTGLCSAASPLRHQFPLAPAAISKETEGLVTKQGEVRWKEMAARAHW
jgi:hypothetical protein